MKICFELDATTIIEDLDPTMKLIDYIRNISKTTGVKKGCGRGECGACAVLINDQLSNSCIIPLFKVHGKKIETIDGFSKSERFKVLEKAFIDSGAVQCGFCTPGMIIATEALLRKNPNPSEEEIKKSLSGNLCRCTGYNMIVDAVKLASNRGGIL